MLLRPLSPEANCFLLTTSYELYYPKIFRGFFFFVKQLPAAMLDFMFEELISLRRWSVRAELIAISIVCHLLLHLDQYTVQIMLHLANH